LPPRPLLALTQPLLERGEREVEEHHERELVLEPVVVDVRGRVPGAHHLVERVDGADVEIGLPAEVAIDLGHVTVE